MLVRSVWLVVIFGEICLLTWQFISHTQHRGSRSSSRTFSHKQLCRLASETLTLCWRYLGRRSCRLCLQDLLPAKSLEGLAIFRDRVSRVGCDYFWITIWTEESRFSKYFDWAKVFTLQFSVPFTKTQSMQLSTIEWSESPIVRGKNIENLNEFGIYGVTSLSTNDKASLAQVYRI